MFFKDTLTIVTIPDYSSFTKRMRLVRMYRDLFRTKIIFVIEKNTRVFDAALKLELDIDTKIKNGLNLYFSESMGVYQINNESISDAYTNICNKLPFDFFCCIDPGVLTFSSHMQLLNRLPYNKWTGAKLLHTKLAAYSPLTGEKPEFILDLELRDYGNFPESDFGPFMGESNDITDYGVLLSRREFLKEAGMFESGANRNFVHSPVILASVTNYTVEYSHELFTYKYR